MKTEDEKRLLKPIPGQVYENYKGGLYMVLHLAEHTTTQEVLVICYSIHFGTYYARPLKEWFELVSIKSENEIDLNIEVTRFRLVK